MYFSSQSASTMPPLSIPKDFKFKPIFHIVEDVELDPKLLVFQTIDIASTYKDSTSKHICILKPINE
jgi:hypothetical protein